MTYYVLGLITLHNKRSELARSTFVLEEYVYRSYDAATLSEIDN